MTQPEKLGFVGLGNMGGALAENLRSTGFDVIANDARGPASPTRRSTSWSSR